MKKKVVIIFFLFFSFLYAKEYQAEIFPKNLSIKEKKTRFYALIVPVVLNIHKKLMQQFLRIKKKLEDGIEDEEIKKLKQIYHAKTNKDLLLALKPHPPSITIAQAAIESAWGSSRFFLKAKNIFGMWSFNKNEPRIPASEKRDGNKTIYLKKFNSLEDSIRAYYKMIATGRNYKEFREIRYKTDDPYKIAQKLDKYSEIGKEYPQQIINVIQYNKLQKYDKITQKEL